MEPSALSTLAARGCVQSVGLPGPHVVVFQADPSHTWPIGENFVAQEVKNRCLSGGGVEDDRVEAR